MNFEIPNSIKRTFLLGALLYIKSAYLQDISTPVSILIFVVFFVGSQYLFPTNTKQNKQSSNIDGLVKDKNTNITGYQSTDPMLGNLGDVGKAGSLHEYLIQEHEKLGDIFSFHFMSEQVVSIGSPEYFKKISHLFDRPPSLFMLFEPMIGIKCIQYANGEDGKNRRKRYIKPALTQSIIDSNCFDIFASTFQTLKPRFDACTEEGISLQDICFDSALMIIIKTAFGNNTPLEVIQQIQESYHKCWEEMEQRMNGSFPNPETEEGYLRNKIFEDNLKIIKDYSKEVLQNAKADNNEKSTKYIDFLKQETDEELIISEIIVMLVGGSHTTANMLIWTIIYLIQNPEKMQKMQQEIDENIKGDLVDHENASKLVYTKNVVKESLRLSVLAPWGARFDQENDIKLPGGETIKKGTPILTPFGYLLQDKKLWGDDVKDFVPERFEKQLSHQMQYQPFGYAGGRVCPGMQLAYSEGIAILAYLYKNYDISIKGNEQIKMVHGLVTHPSIDSQIILKPRK